MRATILTRVFVKCVEVSNEWRYDLDNEKRLAPSERFSQRYIRDRQVPMVHKTLGEVLNPQPVASRVLLRLLAWIDRVDLASQGGSPRPAFLGEDGREIFPLEGDPDEKWWLTELSRRKEEERLAREELLEDGPGSSEEECSDAERKKDSDAETLPGDDGDSCDMAETPSSTAASSPLPRPLPLLSGGVHAPQSSYLRTPSSQLLGSQET